MQENRVYGPPGTGKTSYLANYLEQCADYYGPDRLMVCSYTTAAAAEIASRAASVPEDRVGTLHKFCYGAIGRMPVIEEKAKSVAAWNQFAPGYALSPPDCKDINSGLEYGSDTTKGDALLAETTILRNRLVPNKLWPPQAKAFFEQWGHFKASEGGIDYTDMLEIALRDSDRAPGDPAVIMVDEAQDCTALQFAVLKQWAAHAHRLVMVGDDDQCIYQFAGATPQAFAAQEIGEDDTLLNQSYRVPFKIWEHATNWIDQVPDRIAKDYYPTSEVGICTRAPFSWKQSALLCKLVKQCTERYDSTMILGSCSYMLEPIKLELLAHGIPFHNPYRLIRADWNPLRLSQGTTYAERVRDFLAPKITGKPWWTHKQLCSFASVLKAKGVFRHGMKSKLDTLEIATVDLDTLFEIFQDEAANALLRLDTTWWEANLINDDARHKAKYPLQIEHTLGASFLDASEVPPQVLLGTIHSVKGGEADAVILLPDLSQQGMEQWTNHGRSAIARLMYVGATRAKEALIITKPASPLTCNI